MQLGDALLRLASFTKSCDFNAKCAREGNFLCRGRGNTAAIVRAYCTWREVLLFSLDSIDQVPISATLRHLRELRANVRAGGMDEHKLIETMENEIRAIRRSQVYSPLLAAIASMDRHSPPLRRIEEHRPTNVTPRGCLLCFVWILIQS